MKKFLTILILGLSVFAISCGSKAEISEEGEVFLNSVAGKSMIFRVPDQDIEEEIATFSSDGKKLTSGDTFNLTSALSRVSGTYGASDGSIIVEINGNEVVAYIIAMDDGTTIDSINDMSHGGAVEYTFTLE